MIVLFTDFSYQGSYVGELKAAILGNNESTCIIDLMHDAPMFNIKYSAKLLSCLIDKFPMNSIFCCVVDPGVGSERDAIAIKNKDQYFVGPNNGLFEYIIREESNLEFYQITYHPKDTSNTFHGRDIFAPVCSQLLHKDFQHIKEISHDSVKRINWSDNLAEIIYIDVYGNLVTGINTKDISKDSILIYKKRRIPYARTYSEMNSNKYYWTSNSKNLLEITTNSRNTAKSLSSQIGESVEFE